MSLLFVLLLHLLSFSVLSLLLVVVLCCPTPRNNFFFFVSSSRFPVTGAPETWSPDLRAALRFASGKRGRRQPEDGGYIKGDELEMRKCQSYRC